MHTIKHRASYSNSMYNIHVHILFNVELISLNSSPPLLLFTRRLYAHDLHDGCLQVRVVLDLWRGMEQDLSILTLVWIASFFIN